MNESQTFLDSFYTYFLFVFQEELKCKQDKYQIRSSQPQPTLQPTTAVSNPGPPPPISGNIPMMNHGLRMGDGPTRGMMTRPPGMPPMPPTGMHPPRGMPPPGIKEFILV